MAVRIASAAVGIPLAVLLVFGWGGVLFAPAVSALALIGLNEFYRGARKLGTDPLDWLGRGSCLLLIAWAYYEPDGRLLQHSYVPLMFVFLIGLLIEVLRPQRAPIRNLGATALGVLYVGWLFACLVLLRFADPMDAPVPHAMRPLLQLHWLDVHSYGAWLVLFLLLVVWACDTGAYFTGRLLGKHKLAPSLSPGKTIEGLVGGLVATTTVSLLIGGWVAFPVPGRIIIGLIIGMCCVIGDLAESAMKREIGIKDFGAIMPGHGGVLDRFDSLLFAAPVLYFYVLVR
ncbi:MAG: phosphatidate cytidylyltransferase [Armatimonadota bacterium]|nr:phosphatidate cytidylyltransferase [Armatimonadota bacterium]